MRSWKLRSLPASQFSWAATNHQSKLLIWWRFGIWWIGRILPPKWLEILKFQWQELGSSTDQLVSVWTFSESGNRLQRMKQMWWSTFLQRFLFFFFQTSKLKHHKKTSDPFQFFPVVLSCFLWAYRHPSHFFKPDATRQRSITEKHVRPLRSPMLMIRVTWSPNKATTVVAVGSQNLGKMMHSGRICNMQLWIDSMVWIYIIYNTSSPTNMFFFRWMSRFVSSLTK